MKIIVVGCGKIGTTIIKGILAEGHDVVVIDNSQSVISEISDVYDVMCVCGGAADCETLDEADVSKADMFIAVTGSDELNMLSCYIAKKMGAKHTVARIRNPEYNDKSLGFMKQQLGLSLAINPEMLAARELFNILKLPSAVNIETFSRRNFEMVEIRLKPDSAIDGLSVADLRKKYPANFLVCVVQRGEDVFIPSGDFVLKSGDRIGVTASATEIQKLLKNLGILQKQAKNVMILGASRTAYYLSKMLIGIGNNVKIIDKELRKCERISRTLPTVHVVAGDGAEQDLLLEEGIASMDAFVALTGMDEENILISFFAASQNVPKVISKVNRSEFASLADNMGLECIVSPRKIVADVVLRFSRAIKNSEGSNVETLYKLMDGKAEALEFNVQPDFKYVNINIKDMKLKTNILIAGIIRGRKAIIPSGEDVILAGDKVIVFAAGQSMNDLSDIIG